MSIKPVIIIVVVLALVTMACGFTVTIPVSDINTGPTVTDEINIPVPEAAEIVNLKLGFGAGELKVAPGDESVFVQGTATYNVPDFKPDITVSGDNVRIETGDLEIKGIPSFGDELINEWDLEIAPLPVRLTVEAGAYRGRLELGGLALESVQVTDGASDMELRFSEPNLIEMSTLKYDTGASSVKLRGLANANFEEMHFKGGAGEYTIDFSGELQRDATVTIDSGVSSVSVNVPEGTSARLFFDGGLSNVDVGDDWRVQGDVYVLEGEGLQLTINVNMGAGRLQLESK